MENDSALHERYTLLFPHLNERQKRLVAAADAKDRGRGGISSVARASGLSRPTIHKALRELEEESPLPSRIRESGGGRKKLWVKTPAILSELESLVDPDSRGDPMSPLRWTCKSSRQLAKVLESRGYPVSHPTVAEMLHHLGYSLQANAKALEGSQHPDRDAQFRYIQRRVKDRLARSLPVVSVDTKKKELVGRFKNGGREWQPAGQPEPVNVHDFPDPGVGKAIPYGVYDVAQDLGWVNVGCDHDTASFAVESIRRWWVRMGSPLYPHADKLLICADGGGSNGYRTRLWKWELQRFADETGLEVTVCHFPPGTSKWNKIEHRLFNRIAMNWRGRPLTSHHVVVDLIGATTSESGLRTEAELDTRNYPTQVSVTDEQMRQVNLRPHSFHGEWNYTVCRSKTGESSV